MNSKRARRFFINYWDVAVAKYRGMLRRVFNHYIKIRIRNIGKNTEFKGICTITDFDAVVLGENVHIGEGGYFKTEGGLFIGDNTHISRNLTIYTTNHDYLSGRLPYGPEDQYKPVTIGQNVWIGMGVSICPGVTIGEGAIIGMGVVVHRDVMPLEIVGVASQRVISSRNEESYDNSVATKCYGGRSGKPFEYRDSSALTPLDKGENFVFVVSTGRAGSTTIAEIFKDVGQIEFFHEPKHQLIRLSTEKLHGTKKPDRIAQELEYLFTQGSYCTAEIHGESDQKYSNLISELAVILPKAKFIWVIRNPYDFISSAVGRGWFDDSEFGCDGKGDQYNQSVYSWSKFSKYRPNGSLADKRISESEWRDMSIFERNCWYWSFWNQLIEQQLESVQQERQFFLRIEDLGTRIGDLCSFLGVQTPELVKNGRHNVATYKKFDSSKWSENDREKFLKWCTVLTEKYYQENGSEHG